MSKRWLGLLLFGIWIGRGGVAHAAFDRPAPIDFGDVVVNQSSTKATTLSATSPTTETVTVALEAGGDCAEFRIDSPTGTGTVDHNTSQTVTVTFAPPRRAPRAARSSSSRGSSRSTGSSARAGWASSSPPRTSTSASASR